MNASVVEVKAWATENGLPIGGKRGRLPSATVEAFEAATGQTYFVIDHSPVTDVTLDVLVRKGRKATRQVTVSFPSGDARIESSQGKRGRVPTTDLIAHATGLAQAKGLTVV